MVFLLTPTPPSRTASTIQPSNENDDVSCGCLFLSRTTATHSLYNTIDKKMPSITGFDARGSAPAEETTESDTPINHGSVDEADANTIVVDYADKFEDYVTEVNANQETVNGHVEGVASCWMEWWNLVTSVDWWNGQITILGCYSFHRKDFPRWLVFMTIAYGYFENSVIKDPDCTPSQPAEARPPIIDFSTPASYHPSSEPATVREIAPKVGSNHPSVAPGPMPTEGQSRRVLSMTEVSPSPTFSRQELFPTGMPIPGTRWWPQQQHQSEEAPLRHDREVRDSPGVIKQLLSISEDSVENKTDFSGNFLNLATVNKADLLLNCSVHDYSTFWSKTLPFEHQFEALYGFWHLFETDFNGTVTASNCAIIGRRFKQETFFLPYRALDHSKDIQCLESSAIFHHSTELECQNVCWPVTDGHSYYLFVFGSKGPNTFDFYLRYNKL